MAGGHTVTAKSLLGEQAFLFELFIQTCASWNDTSDTGSTAFR